ncbi:uncharacterized protein LOC123565512 isoform X2 [Mercenaria mercenaria]|nr:uncharacterized protein LOC123565512 isoform X2 [Mercenaria mercenaria]XP_053405329.1 uncharacterized protein LOC123565512 isoform X2 [Mercenaria mercenaria]
MLTFIKMKTLYKRSSSRTSNTGTQRDSVRKLSDSGSRLSDSGSRLSDSSGQLSNSGSVVSTNGINHSGPVTVAVRIYTENKDGASVMFEESDTCESVCLSLAKKLGINPTDLNCFGLGIFDTSQKKYYWLAPCQKPSEVCYNLTQMGENDVFFRMRFLPESSKCDKTDTKCLEYLTWQVKWDFLRSNFSCFSEESKTDEARGISCMLILLELRINTERENCAENIKAFMKGKNLDHFLPVALRKSFLEKRILKENMYKKVESLQEKYPASRCNPHYLMSWWLKVILKQNSSCYSETFLAYELDIDNEEFERIEGDDQPSQIIDKQELIVTVKMDQSYPKLTVSRKSVRNDMLNCYVDNISKLEISQIQLDNDTWWRIHMFRQDGHPVMLYFKDRNEAYSFATCIECYSRLIYDFYDSVCQELEPSVVKELNKLRAHGPVSENFVRKKLVKKNSKDLYILQANLTDYGRYDVFYLPSTTARLKKKTLPKIKQVEEGYIVEGLPMPPQDLKVLINDLVKDTNILPGTCLRIKPQSEGCDLLQSLIMGQEPRDVQGEDEERRERRRIENQPKVYCTNDLVSQSLLGQGHFTEVHSALLCEQDQVVIKKMRVKDIEEDDFRIVQEAFHEGLEKLMALADPQFFVGYMGMTLTPDVCMIMKGTSYRSLKQFLQYREQGLPMLSLHHLLDANIQVASALVYMEERNCYHGNIHCDNISVMNYDNRTMVVRISDPGLVSLYNKLPLTHPVNRKRLPWLAPELHTNLTEVTAQSEVYAYGTTLWQMFSQGLNPVDHDPKLRNKTTDQIIRFFADGNTLSCPQYLHQKNEDPEEIKNVKSLLFRVMQSCWNQDTEERADPKRILKELNSNAQTYEEIYHKYNIIPYFDVVSSAASLYPAASSSSGGTRPQSSGFIYSDQPVLVPDIACLKPEGRRSAGPSNRNENRAQLGNEAEATKSEMSTAVLRPIGAQPAQAVPLQVGQARGAFGAASSRQLGASAATAVVRYNIDDRRLEIDWTAELGKGHYGAVYKGKLYPKDELKVLRPHAGPEIVVVKVLKPEMVARFSEDFKKEAVVMQKLHHQNVVKFYDICHEGEYLVMEYVENNSLHRYVVKCERERQTIQPLTFLQLATHIAAGMEYLESQRVIHCDLAARNVLLTGDLCAKISDFGLSKILSQEKDYYRRTTDKTIPILWCAPEWIGYKRFTSKSDVWSLGVVIWEMYSYGRAPFIQKDVSKIMDALVKGNRLPKPKNCPDSVYTEMGNCWKWEPNDRPDFKQLRIRFEQLCSESQAAVNGTQPSTSRPKQTATRRNTAHSNPSKQAIGKDAATPNKPPQVSVETGKNKSDATKDPTREPDSTRAVGNGLVEQNNTEERLSNSLNRTGERSQEALASNVRGPPAAGPEEEAQSGRDIREGRILSNQSVKSDVKENLTVGEDLLKRDTDKETSVVKSGNQSNSEADRRLISNSTGNRSLVSNQSANASKQLSVGSQQSCGKMTKNGSENIIINKKDLTFDTRDLLGQGGFGKVYRGIYRGETVAVKSCTEPKVYERFKREFNLLFKLKQKSSNIVKFIGLYEDRDTEVCKTYMYVMEYLECSLYSYLVDQKKQGNTVDILKKISFLTDIAKGMDCLFQSSIVHGDLTSKNILLSKDLTAKISDFGWAKELESSEDNMQYLRSDATFQPHWAAPEVFSKQFYTKFTDIWSYGVVCIEVFQDGTTPSLPLPLNELKQNHNAYLLKFYTAIMKGVRFPKPPQCPEELYNEMILKCWRNEYKERIIYKDIIEALSRQKRTVSSQ